MTNGTLMIEALFDATSEAISTMAGFELKRTAAFDSSDPQSELLEATCFVDLDLDGGARRSLVVSFDLPVAKTIVAAMLGLETDDLESDSEVLDGVGELANMAAGVARATLSETGPAFRFSLPMTGLGAAAVPARYAEEASAEVVGVEVAGGRLAIACWRGPDDDRSLDR